MQPATSPDHMATTQRRTRASHNLQHAVPSTNTDSYRFSFFPCTIKIWNILPAASVNAPNVDSFKTAIQHHFLNGTIYTVPPKGQYDRPRLGSSGCVATIGPVYQCCYHWDMYIGMLLVLCFYKNFIAFNLHPALKSDSQDIMPKAARLGPSRIPVDVDLIACP